VLRHHEYLRLRIQQVAPNRLSNRANPRENAHREHEKAMLHFFISNSGTRPLVAAVVRSGLHDSMQAFYQILNGKAPKLLNSQLPEHDHGAHSAFICTLLFALAGTFFLSVP